MATYTVQGPSGKTYTIEGPDGATADQLGAHILSQAPEERAAAQTASDRAQYNPTNDMSTTQRTLAGIGSGMTSVLRAVGGGSIADKLGLPATQADAASVDKPLLATTAGKVGDAIGKTAAVVPLGMAATSAIPALGAGYGGAALLGAGLGGATTEGDLAERAKGAAGGAAGGVVGQGVGSLLSAGASKVVQAVRNATATRAAANAGTDAAATAAQAAGYTLPPTEINPSMINSALEGLSGKVKTAQSASTTNQTVTNNLAQRELGLPANVPITVDALKAIRQQAGQAYDAVGSTGTVTPGQSYSDALDKITAPYLAAAKAFPNSKPNAIVSEIDALRTPSFDAASAVAKIKTLRADADAAYGAGNKDLGASLKKGAAAIEDAIDDHLTATGAPADLLSNFRDARQTIAKTYSVEKALNPVTGDVSAPVLGAQLKRGRPLSGDLLTVAQANQAFPKATQSLSQSYNAVSPLDYLAGLGSLGAGLATGHPLAALGGLSTFVRPAVRATILSRPYQAVAGAGQYSNPLTELLAATAKGGGRLAPVALPAAVVAGQQ